MPVTKILTFLMVSVLSGAAATHVWHQTDGRSVTAEVVERDATNVTLRLRNGKQSTLSIAQLVAADRQWLDAHHPVPPSSVPIFDKLAFNDTRAQVLAKLKSSQFVVMTQNETFIGRGGMNGVFRTRKKVGPLDASLFFAWTDDGLLREITLQTDALPATDRNERMLPCWNEFVELLTSLYGKPECAGSLSLSGIQDGMFSPTHLWQLDEQGGSVQLGAGRSGNDYQIVARFSQKKVVPVEIR